MSSNLDFYQEEIDLIDDKILELLDQRIDNEIAIQVWKFKNGYPDRDLDREQFVVDKYANELGTMGAEIAHAILDI